MKTLVYGKLNLTLYITGMQNDLHLLDSVVTTVSVCDEVEVKISDRRAVRFIGADVSEKNTAATAADYIYDLTGANLDVTIKKHIPIGGGMGGSSADAAAVIYCADKLLGIGSKTDLIKLARRIGSDVPYMLGGGFARILSTGEEIVPIPSAAKIKVLIIECGAVSTGKCYGKFDELPKSSDNNNSEEFIARLLKGEIAADLCHNDLFLPATSLNSRIKQAVDIITQSGYTAHLTGSGGCLFLFDYDEKLIAALKSLGYSTFEAKSTPVGIIEL